MNVFLNFFWNISIICKNRFYIKNRQFEALFYYYKSWQLNFSSNQNVKMIALYVLEKILLILLGL